MFKANDQFIKVQIERGVKNFDIINTDVAEVLKHINDSPPIGWKTLTYTEKEILDLATMPNIPYKVEGNSWVKTDLVTSIP
jgi:hypothetical protein